MKNSNTKVLAATVISLVLVGTYYNSQQITHLKPVVLDHDLPSPTGNNRRHTNNGRVSNQQRASCLTARKDTAPPSMFEKLPRPFVNLGFPKMGTSSLHAFFECGGFKSHHFQCGKDFETNRRVSCARCIAKSMEANKPPLELCEDADIYTQMDNGTYFPQVELLKEFHAGYPKATFFLTFRNMTKWFHSLSHWPPRPRGPHMDERLRKLNITGFPAGRGKNEEEFTEWYCNHVLRVRELVDNSDHHLIEVDIEDSTIGQRMSQMFGISEGCWGHANVNANLHPDVNTSEVTLSKGQAKAMKNEPVVDMHPNDEEIEDYETADNEADNEFEDCAATKNEDEIEDLVYAGMDNEISDGEYAVTDSNEYNASCFHARNDTVPITLHGQLPKPWINLGFPKIGTTSLNAFFGKCGGYKSWHYVCGKRKDGRPMSCAQCVQDSVQKRLAPLANCADGDSWTQLDNGRLFPQIEYLEQILEGYPQATFILMFRGMEKWYNSMFNWPPDRKKYPRLTERLLKLNITGLSADKGDVISTFSDWYCGHIQRVRDMISKYPNHTLVEIDIEDPSTGEYLESLFGIKRECFEQKNANEQPKTT